MHGALPYGRHRRSQVGLWAFSSSGPHQPPLRRGASAGAVCFNPPIVGNRDKGTRSLCDCMRKRLVRGPLHGALTHERKRRSQTSEAGLSRLRKQGAQHARRGATAGKLPVPTCCVPSLSTAAHSPCSTPCPKRQGHGPGAALFRSCSALHARASAHAFDQAPRLRSATAAHGVPILR